MYKTTVKATVIFSLMFTLGCASKQPMNTSAEAAPVPSLEEALSAPRALDKNHFSRDHSGSISEEDLKTVLNAPVFLQAEARVGVVQVVDRYETGEADLTQDTTAVLKEALQDSGLFEAATEISTDWPADAGISGLRELAARYRTEYLLLYRVRHQDRKYANGFGWLFPSVIGMFVAPATTLESFGIIEATLFDVKTGTLLFTTFSRFFGQQKSNLWHRDIKWDHLKKRLVKHKSEELSKKVIESCRILDTARIAYNEKQNPNHPPAILAVAPLKK